MKVNADYHGTRVLVHKTKKSKAKGVLKEQYITLLLTDWNHNITLEAPSDNF